MLGIFRKSPDTLATGHWSDSTSRTFCGNLDGGRVKERTEEMACRVSGSGSCRRRAHANPASARATAKIPTSYARFASVALLASVLLLAGCASLGIARGDVLHTADVTCHEPYELTQDCSISYCLNSLT